MQSWEKGLELWRDINPAQKMEQLKKKLEEGFLGEEETGLLEFLALTKEQHEKYEVEYSERIKNNPLYQHTGQSNPQYYGYNMEPLKLWEYMVLIVFGNQCDLTVVKDYQISTVWLGLDHNSARLFGVKNSDPHIFETMVFYKGNAEGKEEIQDIQEHYSTLEEALAGHEKVVEDVKKLTGKEIVCIKPQTLEESQVVPEIQECNQ